MGAAANGASELAACCRASCVVLTGEFSGEAPGDASLCTRWADPFRICAVREAEVEEVGKADVVGDA